jgi:hypothetical protein
MSNKPYKKPDLNAPRYREKVFSVLNSKLLEEFKEKYPRYKDVELLHFKEIVKQFNETVWEEVIDNRDGVELPDGIGFIFIASTPASKHKNNINFKQSAELGVTVHNKNWETDNRLAKIMYSNYHAKYRFAFRELWGFQAVRQFKRTVAQTFPENYMRYVQLTGTTRVSDIFSKVVDRKIETRNYNNSIDEYNEFELD